MLWNASIIINTVIAVAFAMIAGSVFTGLRNSGQLKTMLGLATAAIFASSALSHLFHAIRKLMPLAGIDAVHSYAVRQAYDWHLDVIDAVTMLVALWYWSQRPTFKQLLDGSALFADLQRKYDSQARLLESTERVADVLQRALTPKELPTAGAVAFDAVYVPAEDRASVGGDWYDVFALPDGRIAFSIGDVTGHGLDAAVTTSKTREAIAAAAFFQPSPGAVLASANRMLTQRGSPVVTALYGTIEPATLQVSYATAGHPPPVFAARNAAAVFGDYDGLALGIDSEAQYPTFTRTLARGSLAVFYTDGVVEYDRDIIAGERRLLDAVTRHATESVALPSRAILQDVLDGAAASDDIALLTVTFIGDPVVVELDGERVWRFDVKDAAAATVLRHEITACIVERAPSTDAVIAELITGELLSNVVKHTPGTIDVVLCWQCEPALLTVSDRGQGFAPRARLPDNPFSENGRGMFLVDALAKAVDYRTGVDGGSVIQVSLPTRQAILETTAPAPT